MHFLDSNYLNFNNSIYSNIKIALSDINLDAKKDLVLVAQNSTSNTQEIFYNTNVSTSFDYQFSNNNSSLFQTSNASSLHIADSAGTAKLSVPHDDQTQGYGW